MIVTFRRDIEHPPTSLVVDNISLERVESYKLLGLTMQNNLKWDVHVNEIVAKASKRIHMSKFKLRKQTNIVSLQDRTF